MNRSEDKTHTKNSFLHTFKKCKPFLQMSKKKVHNHNKYNNDAAEM